MNRILEKGTVGLLKPVLTLIATGILWSAIVPSAVGGLVAAHLARTLNGTATAHLHLIKAEGSQLIEEGSVSGALVGSAHGSFHTGAVFTGNLTIHTQDGSITGHGQAIPRGSGRYQSFHGSFLTTSGAGRYAHVNGRAELYGVLDRRHDSVIIQTTGRLTY